MVLIHIRTELIMANWAYVENNTVIEVFDNLPKNWRNISNLDAAEGDLEFLKSLLAQIHNKLRLGKNPITCFFKSKLPSTPSTPDINKVVPKIPCNLPV